MANWSEADLALIGFGPGGERLVPRYPSPTPVAPTPGPTPAKRHKYGAVRTEGPDPAGGRRMYDSKASAALAEHLEMLKRSGQVDAYFVEPSVEVGTREDGKRVRYRPDAMSLAATAGGEVVVRFFDAKRGRMDTRTSIAKRAALRARGLNVELWTAA